MPRAVAMAPAARREALIEATAPLLLEHGRAVTTRQIAEAAGVAEGTIFRAFATKDELVDAAVGQALDPEPWLRDLRRIDPDQGLPGVLLDLVAHIQMRLTSIFALMAALGMVGPPEHLRRQTHPDLDPAPIMASLVEPYRDRLRCRPDELVHLLRLLTFAGSHEHISQHRTLEPEQIVDVLLHGVLRERDGGRA